MHMRTKKWAKPELAVCPYFTDEPETKRGRWRAQFEREQPLYLELGCGKGVSTAAMVKDNPTINYVAVDITCNVLGDTRRNIEKAFDGEPVKNVMIARYDISYIEKVFAPEDRVERIYINFCNPWNKKANHKKHRLTHTRQLLLYRPFLADGAEIWFKCDDDDLFKDTLRYMAEAGFEVTWQTRDLHADEPSWNIRTEHEQMFTEMGIPTKALIARKTSLPENAPAPCIPHDIME